MPEFDTTLDTSTTAKLRRIDAFLAEAANGVDRERDRLQRTREKLQTELEILRDLAEFRGGEPDEALRDRYHQYSVRRKSVSAALKRSQELRMRIDRARTHLRQLRYEAPEEVHTRLQPLDPGLGLDDANPHDLSDLRSVLSVVEDIAEASGIEIDATPEPLDETGGHGDGTDVNTNRSRETGGTPGSGPPAGQTHGGLPSDPVVNSDSNSDGATLNDGSDRTDSIDSIVDLDDRTDDGDEAPGTEASLRDDGEHELSRLDADEGDA